jgi:ADP-ribose pyrophosphatase YjhB (NUDIX family)
MTASDWYKQAFYRVSLKALIRNDKNEILMVREKKGDFSLPGGGWDYEESMHEALKRELFEEIALTSNFTEKIITALPFYNPNKDAWQMWVAYEINYSDQLHYGIGADADEVVWVREDEIDTTTLAGKLIKQVLAVNEQ